MNLAQLLPVELRAYARHMRALVPDDTGLADELNAIADRATPGGRFDDADLFAVLQAVKCCHQHQLRQARMDVLRAGAQVTVTRIAPPQDGSWEREVLLVVAANDTHVQLARCRRLDPDNPQFLTLPRSDYAFTLAEAFYADFPPHPTPGLTRRELT